MRTIIVQAYGPAWPAEFTRIRDWLWPHVSDLALEHHLYVCPQDRPEYRRWLLFTGWLRGHDEDRDAYAALKRELAKRYPHDIDAYIAGKSEFVEGILQKCAS